MTQQQIEAIRAEVWQAPDGTLTWIVSMVEQEAGAMGFSHGAVGAMVRSSYHADQQAHAAGVAGTLA